MRTRDFAGFPAGNIALIQRGTCRWTLVEAWGDYAGTKGSGSLVGVPFEGGITDAYTGTVR